MTVDGALSLSAKKVETPKAVRKRTASQIGQAEDEPPAADTDHLTSVSSSQT